MQYELKVQLNGSGKLWDYNESKQVQIKGKSLPRDALLFFFPTRRIGCQVLLLLEPRQCSLWGQGIGYPVGYGGNVQNSPVDTQQLYRPNPTSGCHINASHILE